MRGAWEVGPMNKLLKCQLPAAEIKKPPTSSASHIFHFHAVEGGEVEHEVVGEGGGAGDGKAARPRPGIGIEPAQDAPGITGKAIANGGSNQADALEQIAGAQRLILRVEELKHALGEIGIALLTARREPEMGGE